MIKQVLKRLLKFRWRNHLKNKFLLWTARFTSGLFVFVLLLETNFLWLTGNMPDIKEVRNPEVAIASELFSDDSILLGRYYTENRTPIYLSSVAPIVVDALVSTEDARFYHHHGFDLFALFGSVSSAANGDKRGGSTLTQQLAKNMFDTRSDANRGLLGKIPVICAIIYKAKEWITASKLELFYTKAEILEMYLNTVDFGNNWFGVKVASQNYFGKQPLELNIQEAALLIGMLKATSSYNPFRNLKMARERRNIVIGQLLKYKKINQHEHDSIIRLAIIIKKRKVDTEEMNDSYIRTYVGELAKKWCEKNGYNLYEDGLHIYTTINSKLQQYAENALHDHLKKMQKQFNDSWGKRNPWCDENGKEIPGFIESTIKRTAVFKILFDNWLCSYLNVVRKFTSCY